MRRRCSSLRRSSSRSSSRSTSICVRCSWTGVMIGSSGMAVRSLDAARGRCGRRVSCRAGPRSSVDQSSRLLKRPVAGSNPAGDATSIRSRRSLVVRSAGRSAAASPCRLRAGAAPDRAGRRTARGARACGRRRPWLAGERPGDDAREVIVADADGIRVAERDPKDLRRRPRADPGNRAQSTSVASSASAAASSHAAREAARRMRLRATAFERRAGETRDTAAPRASGRIGGSSSCTGPGAASP